MSTQITYYMTPADAIEADAAVVAMRGAVVLHVEDATLQVTTQRQALRKRGAWQQFAWSHPQFLTHVRNRVIDTERGLRMYLDVRTSPFIEADAVLPQGNELLEARFYAWTPSDFATRQVAFDTEAFAQFVRGVMYTWRRHLTRVELSNGAHRWVGQRALEGLRARTLVWTPRTLKVVRETKRG